MSAVRATQLCACLRPLFAALPGAAAVTCGGCGRETPLRAGAVDAAGALSACAFCGCPELYRQRDFHQALGCGIMLAAAALSLVVHLATGNAWWLAVLAAGVLLDAVLYRVLPDRVGCYVCHAEFRGATNEAAIARYDLHAATRIEYAGPRRAAAVRTEPPAG